MIEQRLQRARAAQRPLAQALQPGLAMHEHPTEDSVAGKQGRQRRPRTCWTASAHALSRGAQPLTTWASAMDLDFVAAYFRRVGVTLDPAAVRPDLETLGLLQDAHLRGITFENIDVVLSRPISISRHDVVRKFVHSKRGGYCFEQNSLLMWVLEALG